MTKYKIIYLCIFLLFFVFNLKAQEEVSKEVRVVKPYVPTLSDAEKINFLPEFNDTSRVYADFDYQITPKPYSTHFRVKPISPAKMVGLPLKRLYKSQLSLGVGNYLSPFAELTVNQLRDRKTAIGLYVKHHSSGGKVKLDNDEKVDAGYSDNDLNLYGRKIFKHSVVDGNLNAGYNSVLYYGYDPYIDTVLDKDDIRQKIYSLGGHLKFYSSNPDSSHFNYNSRLDYDFVADHYGYNEQGVRIKAEFAKFIDDWYSGIETGLELYDRSKEADSSNNALISFNPRVSKATQEWNFVVGLNSAFDIRNGETRFNVYPNVQFEFNIVQNVLIPYMGITGYKEVNSYRKMLMKNPFITPGTVVENTNYSMIGFLGLKGRYSSKMAFDFRIKYSQADSMYFFVNNTADTLKNQFSVEYDDLSILNAGGEVSWNQNEKLKFILRGDYFKYDLDQQAYAWHRPAFKASLNASYNLRDKILVDANLFFTGKRYAPYDYDYYELPMVEGPGYAELKPYFDANLAAEYRYTSMLSFFVKLNNLSASRYQEWFLYPVQRFQAIIGFSYAL